MYQNTRLFGGLVKNILIFCLIIVSQLSLAASFPENPDYRTTPGSLCTTPDAHRYPEGIPYCSRNVETQTKQEVIRIYEEKLGFEIYRYGRNHFKIDHLIPLCAGGSNRIDNLWPQHETVYRITDPIEFMLCEKMKVGRLSQKDAVHLILEVKHDLSKAREVTREINAL